MSSLVLSLLALVGSVAAMAYIGLTVIPVEAGSGYYFSDTPGAYQVTVVIAAASMILWTLLGIAGIICAIVALVRRARPAAPVLALCVGVLAPLLSIGVLEATMEIASTRL